MTDAERSRLRELQDTWLELPPVQRHVANWGWGESIAIPGDPTFAHVRDMILPDWAGWFQEFIDNGGDG